MDEGKVETRCNLWLCGQIRFQNPKTIGQPKLSLRTLSSGAEINIRRRDGGKNGSEVREAFLSGLTDDCRSTLAVKTQGRIGMAGGGCGCLWLCDPTPHRPFAMLRPADTDTNCMLRIQKESDILTSYSFPIHNSPGFQAPSLRLGLSAHLAKGPGGSLSALS